jgi:hypothetical protein
MNILGLFPSQKRQMVEATMPRLLPAVGNPSVSCGEALVARSLTFANTAKGARVEELVHPLYILRTGVL